MRKPNHALAPGMFTRSRQERGTTYNVCSCIRYWETESFVIIHRMCRAFKTKLLMWSVRLPRSVGAMTERAGLGVVASSSASDRCFSGADDGFYGTEFGVGPPRDAGVVLLTCFEWEPIFRRFIVGETSKTSRPRTKRFDTAGKLNGYPNHGVDYHKHLIYNSN